MDEFIYFFEIAVTDDTFPFPSPTQLTSSCVCMLTKCMLNFQVDKIEFSIKFLLAFQAEKSYRYTCAKLLL